MFFKKELQNFHKIHKNTPVPESSAVPQVTYLKRDSRACVFVWIYMRFCEIFRNILFYWTTPGATSYCHKIQNIGINKFSASFIQNILEYH